MPFMLIFAAHTVPRATRASTPATDRVLVMALLAGVLFGKGQQLCRSRAVCVVTHPATCQLVRLVAMRSNERLFGMTALAPATESEAPAAADAVAVSAFGYDRRMVDISLAICAGRGVPRVKDHFLSSRWGFEAQNVLAR